MKMSENATKNNENVLETVKEALSNLKVYLTEEGKKTLLSSNIVIDQ